MSVDPRCLHTGIDALFYCTPPTHTFARESHAAHDENDDVIGRLHKCCLHARYSNHYEIVTPFVCSAYLNVSDFGYVISTAQFCKPQFIHGKTRCQRNRRYSTPCRRTSTPLPCHVFRYVLSLRVLHLRLLNTVAAACGVSYVSYAVGAAQSSHSLDTEDVPCLKSVAHRRRADSGSQG